jgi:hypothetical protein
MLCVIFNVLGQSYAHIIVIDIFLPERKRAFSCVDNDRDTSVPMMISAGAFSSGQGYAVFLTKRCDTSGTIG